MNGNRINELLERYYDALTNEAEERELKRFFESGDVPPQMQTEKEIFLQIQRIAETDMPEGLEERLTATIDRWEAEERKVERKTRVLFLQRIGGIAASLLLLATFGWYMYEPQPVRKDTCATPEEAYMHAQRALAMFTTTLNKGMARMDAAQATTERIERTIQEQFNKINE